jgi:hypothetical protein
MAEMDRLIEKMVERHVERAVLVNDQPMRLFLGSNETSGPAIPMVKLHEIVREVTPANLRVSLAQDCKFQFPHQSPHGAFTIAVERRQNRLQVSVASTPKPQAAPSNDYLSDSAWPTLAQIPSPAPVSPSYHPIAPPTPPSHPSSASHHQPVASVGCLPVIGVMFLCIIALFVAMAVIGESAPLLIVIGTSIWVAFDAQAIGVRKVSCAGRHGHCI